MDPAERFFETVYGDVAGCLVIWTPKGAPLFFEGQHRAAHAARAADELAKEHDVYFGVGLLAKSPRAGRGKTEDVTVIPGVWADVDIRGAHHKQPNLPPSLKAAKRVLREVGARPTIIWHSGHGLQAFWLFREPWIIETPEERQQVRTFTRQWDATVRATARVHEWNVDAVGDLTRVLRIPGTWNRKGVPIRVQIIVPPDLEGVEHRKRYNPSDLETFLVDEEAIFGEQETQAPVVLKKVSKTAEPPSKKLTAMIENDKKFAKTWDRARPDLQDQSPSAYEISLATQAVLAGCWTNDEIAALLVAWGREHRGADEHPEKIFRKDYLERTIARAHRGVHDGLDDNDVINENIIDDAKSQGQAAVLTYLQKRLGVPLVAVIKRGSQDARYSLRLKDGREIPIGKSRQVLAQGEFAAAVFDATDYHIRRVKATEWRKITNMFATIMQHVTLVEDDRASEVEGWVCDYLEDRSVFTDDQWVDALGKRFPFIRNKLLHVHMKDMRGYLKTVHDIRITGRELGTRLSEIGFTRIDVSGWCPDRKETLSRSCWQAPAVRFMPGKKESAPAPDENLPI